MIPDWPQMVVGCPSHMLLRAYASLHMLGMYAGCLCHVPALQDTAWCAAAAPELKLLGLFQPSIAAGVLPVFLLILLVSP